MQNHIHIINKDNSIRIINLHISFFGDKKENVSPQVIQEKVLSIAHGLGQVWKASCFRNGKSVFEPKVYSRNEPFKVINPTPKPKLGEILSETGETKRQLQNHWNGIKTTQSWKSSDFKQVKTAA